MRCAWYVRRIAGFSELTVRNGTVWRNTKGRIVTKQDKFYPGGLADNFTGFAERKLLRLAQVKVQMADNASVELNVFGLVELVTVVCSRNQGVP